MSENRTDGVKLVQVYEASDGTRWESKEQANIHQTVLDSRLFDNWQLQRRDRSEYFLGCIAIPPFTIHVIHGMDEDGNINGKISIDLFEGRDEYSEMSFNSWEEVDLEILRRCQNQLEALLAARQKYEERLNKS